MSLEDGDLSFVYLRESHRVDLLSGHVCRLGVLTSVSRVSYNSVYHQLRDPNKCDSKWETSETVSRRPGSHVSTSSMSRRSMVLVFEGTRSFNGLVNTKRLACMWTSPEFPAAMPIHISRGMVPWSVSNSDVAIVSNAWPHGCVSLKSGSGRAICMRFTAVSSQA